MSRKQRQALDAKLRSFKPLFDSERTIEEARDSIQQSALVIRKLQVDPTRPVRAEVAASRSRWRTIWRRSGSVHV